MNSQTVQSALDHLNASFSHLGMSWGLEVFNDASTSSNGEYKAGSYLDEKRKAETLGGRRAAAMALKNLGSAAQIITTDSLPSGAPLWPAGTTGSIAHQKGVAVAAVALKEDMDFLGVDLQEVLESNRAQKILNRITTESERDKLPLQGLPTGTWVFSAKEACFKALSPLNLTPPCTRISQVKLICVNKSLQGLFEYPTDQGPITLRVFSTRIFENFLVTLASPT